MPQIVKEEIEKWFKETYPKGDLYENIYLDKNESGARLKKKIFALALCMVLAMMPSMVPSESMTLTSLSRISSLIKFSLLMVHLLKI